jgi:hypothetical protein
VEIGRYKWPNAGMDRPLVFSKRAVEKYQHNLPARMQYPPERLLADLQNYLCWYDVSTPALYVLRLVFLYQIISAAFYLQLSSSRSRFYLRHSAVWIHLEDTFGRYTFHAINPD